MKLTPQMVQECRSQFPALSQTLRGQPIIYCDGPAGTQVPRCVVDGMSDYLFHHNANVAGVFESSLRSDQMLAEGHQAAADFVGARDPGEIAFGQNMTSLTLALSRSLALTWSSGDEIVVTRLDHDANITPWVLAAQDRGVTVRYVGFRQDDYTLDMDEMAEAVTKRTRMVAIGAASNATGGINPVKQICKLAKDNGALAFVDAVHMGPHGLIDVQEWNCDFLACSAYKFFGPHLGIMWGKRGLLETLAAYKVRPAPDDLPGKWMNGTQSHESIIGTCKCIDYLADLGRAIDGNQLAARRDALRIGLQAISEYEASLSTHLIDSLGQIPDLKIYGITEVSRIHERVPTFSIRLPTLTSEELARRLADQGVFVWNGNYYALQFSEQLGLEPDGMVRIGLVHYNTHDEVDRLVDAIVRSVSPMVASRQ